MEVNFDNLRRNGVKAYNSLCEELNGRIQFDETIGVSKKFGDPLTVGDIEQEMRNLRDFLATLICCENEKQGINCLDDIDLVVFAPEEE
jgi:hypothetical protein